MPHALGPEFLSLWDNPEEYVTLVFEQLGAKTFTIKIVVDAPGCPVLTFDMAPMEVGRA